MAINVSRSTHENSRMNLQMPRPRNRKLFSCVLNFKRTRGEITHHHSTVFVQIGNTQLYWLNSCILAAPRLTRA